MPVEPVRSAKKTAEVQAPVQDAAAAESFFAQMSHEDKAGIVKQLNKTLEAFDTHVSLSVDEVSHQNVIRVVDSQTGKVIRQIPSEQLLKISQRITELLGVIYDEKM